MARILIATVPVIGHLKPILSLARSLVSRGHEVSWYSGQKYRDVIASTGAIFYPYVSARDYDDSRIDAEFPGRVVLKGIAQLKYDLKHVFIDAAPGQLTDLEAIAAV